jgi:Rieske Fe-S protein
MYRREFTKSCLMCLSGALMIPVFYGCQSTHYATGTMEPYGISIPASEFRYLKKDQEMIRQYIIVRNEALEFPIYLYRFTDNEYAALLMKCTHQGNELQAFGDHLHCSAHGSEFNNKGVLAQGPAEKNLRAFKVSAGKKIFIDLRS